MDIIMGLDIGGDDYITKPFKLGVLVSRVNALLRWAKDFNSADTGLESNGIKVLLLQGQTFKNGKLLDLTAAKYKLLCWFMRNPNIVLTKAQILDKLWDCDTGHPYSGQANPEYADYCNHQRIIICCFNLSDNGKRKYVAKRVI